VEIQKQLSGKVFSKGPNGEDPVPPTAISLTPDEIAKIKAMNATAAISLHYGGNDWSTAQVNGMKARAAELGINVIAVTDANFLPQKQVSDVETLMARKPNIILSIPTDAVATAQVFKKAAAAGVILVFADVLPKGMVPGKEYVGVGSSDNYGNGVASGYLMAAATNRTGKIGIIYWDTAIPTKDRHRGFQDTITNNYPDIKIIESKEMPGPDWAGDAQKAAAAILTAHPDVKALWTVWDVPADGAIAAARAANRKDLINVTEDLGLTAAVAIAKKDLLFGLGAQRPYDCGVVEMTLAGYGLLGKTAPPFVEAPALPVSRSNVLQAWQDVYHAPAPDQLTAAYKAGGG